MSEVTERRTTCPDCECPDAEVCFDGCPCCLDQTTCPTPKCVQPLRPPNYISHAPFPCVMTCPRCDGEGWVCDDWMQTQCPPGSHRDCRMCEGNGVLPLDESTRVLPIEGSEEEE